MSPIAKRRNLLLALALALVVLASGFGIFANSGASTGSSSAALKPAGAPANTNSGSAASYSLAAAKSYPNGITVIPEIKHDTSAPLRDIKPIATGPGRSEGDERENPPHGTSPAVPKVNVDKSVQTNVGPSAMPTPIFTYDGITNRDGVYPPDNNGDVGPNNYVEWINLSFQIYDKSGHSLYGPAEGNTLWTGFGGPCQTTNDGDPITLYDHMADRWLMSQFALPNYPSGPFYECIAISQTGDPTGAWNRYQFQTSATKMDDYPKLAVWPDAYYMGDRLFSGNNWAGVGAYAFDRARMLQGLSATMQLFEMPPSEWEIALPADLDGPTLPPAGAPETFVEIVNHDWDPGNIPTTAVLLYKYHVDWNNPGNTTWTGPVTLPTSAWNPFPCTNQFNRNCVAQQGTSVKLDALDAKAMYRAAYRNFGDHESIVFNHTVDGDGTQAGHVAVRWYEIRGINTTPSIYQQSTYAPSDGKYRWMGSAAMDHDGNMAIGYSVSNSSMYPSIAYAGRLATDPLNELTQGEASFYNGTGAQTGTGSRWGDYTVLKVDPTDDCTFWYINEYVQTTGSAPWRTRIGSFKFPGCNAGVSTPTPTTVVNTPTPTATSVVNTPTATHTTVPGTPTSTVTPCAMTFTDVLPTDYFYTAVHYLYCEGAISGYADNTFRPYNNTTRGQLSKIIVLAEGWPLLNPPNPTFTDVLPGSTFYTYVETASSHGIISGYADHTFRPGNNVTRGQLSKIIVLAEEWTLLNPPTPTFSDVPTSNPFYTYVETAFNHGIISGYADGTFRPGNDATRGQISKIVYLAVTNP